MAEIKVADISRWQGTINWNEFKNNIQGVVIKATGSDGGLYTDSALARNRDEARRVGVPVWFYHYKGSGTPEDQAQYFVNAIGGLRAGEGLVLDDENEATVNVDFDCKFADKIKALTGLNIVLYSNQSRFGGVNLQPIKDRNIGAWSAKYGSNSGNPEPPSATAGILPVIMWQYTSTARVGGVTENSVDMNIFYGDVAAFQAYGAAGNVPAPKPPTPNPSPAPSGTYTVQKGDTLSGIGAKLGIPWQDIARWNGITAPYTIYPGQVLKVYGGSAGGGNTTSGTYTVVAGDTLSGIGTKTGYNWQSIATLNSIAPPYIIYPGQVLKLPGGNSSSTSTYTVVAGDTLSGIGQKTGKNWQDIARINNIKAPYTIYPGQVLKLS